MRTSEPELYHPVSLNREYLAGRMLERFAERYPRMWKDFSMENRVRLREEYLAALTGLEESLATGSPAFLLCCACWLRSRFAVFRIPEEGIRAFFSVFRDVLATEVPQDYRQRSAGFARKALSIVKDSTACPEEPVYLAPAARSFLACALDGDDAGAAEIISAAFSRGMPLEDIYTGIFGPVLKETGKLWEQGRITIAQEHHTSDAVRRSMDQLRTEWAGTVKKRHGKGIAVAACVGQELHEIGIRMVADLLERDGWTVYFTGGNTPAGSVFEAVKERNAEVVVVSITMPSRLADLRYLIRKLRIEPGTAGVRIIVGGFPFTVVPGLWKQIGADAVALNAMDAVSAAGSPAAKTKKELSRSGLSGNREPAGR